MSLEVDTLADESDGDYGSGDFSLREAIGLANGSVESPDAITFAGTLTAGGPGTIRLTRGELRIRRFGRDSRPRRNVALDRRQRQRPNAGCERRERQPRAEHR